MALADAFLSPAGLLALLALVPLVVLYLVRPTPRTLELPTFRFLGLEQERETRRVALSRLRRNLLLLLQALTVVLVALALASPYVSVSRAVAGGETVVVVDASASMATETGEGTRFARAVEAAAAVATGETSVVVSEAGTRVALREGSRREAREVLEALRVSDASGSLQSAVSQAMALAGEDARVVVVSDFVDDSDWRLAVETGRARGLTIDLRQVGGHRENVGIVDLSFEGSRVGVTIQNTGTEPARRTVALGNRTRTVRLQPGDRATEAFAVPTGASRVRLSSGDAFPTDDVAYLAAPSEAQIDVLLLSGDGNRYLRTALSVIDEVSLDVATPPTTVGDRHDVLLFGDVSPDDLLRQNVEAARRTLDRGGGVGITAGTDLGRLRYGDLLLVDPDNVANSSAGPDAAEDPLTRGISFPPPGEHVTGDLRAGRPLVETAEGAPLVATDRRGPGRLLYYGYLESSSFKFNYLYPVFWKRAVFFLADREPLPSLNRRTGERLQLGEPTVVTTPTGERTVSTLVLDRAGVYRVGQRELAASLLDARESNVTVPSLRNGSVGTGGGGPVERERVPLVLGPWVALAAVGGVLLELGFLWYRGDV